MGGEARQQQPAVLPDLPLVLTMRDLVKLSGLPGEYAHHRLRRQLDRKGIPRRASRGSGGSTYDLEALARGWPEFVRAIRLRLATDPRLKGMFPDYAFFAAP